MSRLLAILISLALLVPAALPAATASAAGPMIATDRLVLAFHYAWWDLKTWSQGVTVDKPAVLYKSDDTGAMGRQIDQAKAAGIDVFISAWQGQDFTDANFRTLLGVAQSKGFRVAPYFETTSPLFHNPGEVVNALRYLTSSYGNHPAYLKQGGKPVVFFWRPPAIPGTSNPHDAWAGVRGQVDPNHQQFWVGEGTDVSFLSTFDGIHPYSIAWSTTPGWHLAGMADKARTYANQIGQPKLWAATAMPGYDDTRTGRTDAFARDRAGGTYYRQTFEGAIATNPEWLLITSWNEWIEGTAIEPAASFGNTYLDITREYTGRFKNSAPAAPAPSARGADYDIPNGHFFTQANGQGGAGGTGFAVTNDGGVPFWREFNRLGGLQVIGYPISRRFTWDGFTVQAFQKMVLQWRPEVGEAYFVNVMDILHRDGKDSWLEAVRATPPQWDTAADNGLTWGQIVDRHLGFLNGNPAIRARYFADSDPVSHFGLPVSFKDYGNVVVVRTQRAVFQQWKTDTAWAKAGQVVIANSSDIAKELGVFPGDAVAPEAGR